MTDAPDQIAPPDEIADCPGLDPGIQPYVKLLREAGIETCQSCQGGTGHAYPEPTVEFHGTYADGFRALATAQTFGLPIAELRRVWTIDNGEPVGPVWAMTFRYPADEHARRTEHHERYVFTQMGKTYDILANAS